MTLLTDAPDSTRAPEPSPDPARPLTRLSALLDAGSVRPLAPPDRGGVVAVRGLVAGARVVAFCTDPTIERGALGRTGCRHIVTAVETALRERCPVVGLWHSAGPRLTEGVDALDGVGRVLAATTRASGRIPQISVVLGVAAGGAAYAPALGDVVVMAPAARVFLAAPEAVREVTGEHVDHESLGGPSAHAARSGVAHVVAADEADALRQARRLAELFARPGRYDLAAARTGDDPGAVLPDRPQRAYDVRLLLHRLLDRDGSVELHPRWAPNIVTTLGRLAGRTIGVLANNPLRLGGCLTASAAEKAARFVRMCDALGVPLVVVVDVPGYLPGVGQEWDGVVRRGAKLLHAFAEAVVPRVTLVTRKTYGGAYLAMNSRALGATAVFAWPAAEVAVMGAHAAVDILHRRTLAAAPPAERGALRDRLAAEQAATAGGVDRAREIGVVDDVVPPPDSRFRLARALSEAAPRRGRHGNIPL